MTKTELIEALSTAGFIAILAVITPEIPLLSTVLNPFGAETGNT
jgi:hypothetical protein